MIHTNNGQQYWLQEVDNNENGMILDLERNIYQENVNGVWGKEILFPFGTWQIHSDSLTITEDQASELVEGINIATGGDDYQDYYRNYEGSQLPEDWPWFSGDTIKSFGSLLRSLGLQDKRIIVLKKINP